METLKTKRDRLRNWIKGLTEDQKKEIILELVEEFIERNEIVFLEDVEKPYWSNSGEYIDKT